MPPHFSAFPEERLHMRFVLQFGMGAVDHNFPVAKAAEEAGFDGLACGDSFMYPKHSDGVYPYTEDGDRSFIAQVPFIDPAVLISAWAMITKKLFFYPSVYKFPSRNPIQVAKVWTSLAVLTGERVKFGLGTSPWEEDFTMFGLPFAGRGARMEEGIEIFRGLQTGNFFGYNGKCYQFAETKINPVPKKPIPILLGGHAPIAMKRAARIGDGWISANVTFDVLKPLVEQVNAYRREFGTASRPFEMHGFDVTAVDPATCRRTQDIGVTDLQVLPWMMLGMAPSLQEKLDSIKRFGDEVIAKFR
jgi:alkanesulfonate monooxygenase SsuD/methylene tetrahydromethanopterin reductase-like flavin-dependent oxidoreductase (luciferase family)